MQQPLGHILQSVHSGVNATLLEREGKTNAWALKKSLSLHLLPKWLRKEEVSVAGTKPAISFLGRTLWFRSILNDIGIHCNWHQFAALDLRTGMVSPGREDRTGVSAAQNDLGTAAGLGDTLLGHGPLYNEGNGTGC